MKNKFQRLVKWSSLAFMSGMIAFSSCKKEEKNTDDNSNNDSIPRSIPKYSALSFVGENYEEYLVTTDDLTSGKISIIGNGLETASYGSVVYKDGYYYMSNYITATVDQYRITETGFNKISSISISALSSEGVFRLLQITQDGDLLMTNWPDEEGNVPYAIVEIPSFTVKSNGSFVVPKVAGFDAVEIGGVVKDDKIYLGTMYSNLPENEDDKTGWTKFPDSLITVIYDYPSFTNPEVIVSDASLGTTAGYSGTSSVLDEKGDIYQQNIRSKHWYNMGTREEMPTVFVRIRDGKYDDSYEFNISDEFNNTISLIGFIYVGDGIAYGKILNEDATDEWAVASSTNTISIAKIDLYNQTVTQLNIPESNGMYLNKGVVEDGKLYIPISIVGEGANVYEITIGGGADDFVKGAQLDGNNVQTQSLYKH